MQQPNLAMIKTALETDNTLTPTLRKAALQALIDATSGREKKSDGPRVIKWKAAAEMLGMTRQALYKFAKEGKLEPVSVRGGRSYGVTAASLDRFISEATGTGASYRAEA